MRKSRGIRCLKSERLRLVFRQYDRLLSSAHDCEEKGTASQNFCVAFCRMNGNDYCSVSAVNRFSALIMGKERSLTKLLRCTLQDECK